MEGKEVEMEVVVEGKESGDGGGSITRDYI